MDSAGDIAHKRFITSDADTNMVDLDGTEDYVILACDGLWDVLEPEKLPHLVYGFLQQTKGDKSSVAKQLVEWAKDNGSSDNITVLTVFLNDHITAPVEPETTNNIFSFGQSEEKEDEKDKESKEDDQVDDNSSAQKPHLGPEQQSPSTGQHLDREPSIKVVISEKNKYSEKYKVEKRVRKSSVREKSLGEKELVISESVQFSVDNDNFSIDAIQKENIPLPKDHVLKKDPVFILEMPKNLVPQPLKEMKDFRSASVPYPKPVSAFRRLSLDANDPEEAERIPVASFSNRELLEPVHEYRNRAKRKGKKKDYNKYDTVNSVKRINKRNNFSDPSSWPSVNRNRIPLPNYKLSSTRGSLTPANLLTTSFSEHSAHYAVPSLSTDYVIEKSVKKHQQLEPLASSENKFKQNLTSNQTALANSVQDNRNKNYDDLVTHPVTIFGSRSVNQSNLSNKKKFRPSWRPKRNHRSHGGVFSEVPPTPLSNVKLSSPLEE